MSHQQNRKLQPGVTLVELLVVITILVLVVGVVLPLAQPVLRSRGVREASRQINALFAAAQAKAMSEQRAHGVMIRRSPGNPDRAFELMMVKMPGVYTGDSSATYSSITPHGTSPMNPWLHTLEGASAALVQGFLKVGDTVRFAHRGPFYQITNVIIQNSGIGGTSGVLGGGGGGLQPKTTIEFAPLLWNPDPDNPLSVYDPITTPTQVAPPTLSTDVQLSFEIVRQPRPTSAKPLVLPQGTFIDLAHSGVGTRLLNTTGHFNSVPSPVIIMFNADGSLGPAYAHVFRDLDGDGIPQVGPYRFQITDAIYLLVSRPLSNSDDSLSIDAESLWISISQKTGRVATYQNVGATATTAFERSRLARAASTQAAQTVGGR